MGAGTDRLAEDIVFSKERVSLLDVTVALAKVGPSFPCPPASCRSTSSSLVCPPRFVMPV